MTSTTTSKQFNAKVHGLQELQLRIENENSAPTSKDIISHLKYFHTTLSSWIKDTNDSFDFAKHEFKHSNFPEVDYEILFNTLLDFLALTQSIDDEELDNSLLKAIAYVLPYLPTDTLISAPTSLVIGLFDVNSWMQTQIVDMLVQYLLPLIFVFLTENIDDEMAEINLVAPSLLASILDATTDTATWTRVMECFMRFKRDSLNDILMNLAYGSDTSLEAFVHLLNRYFVPVDIASVKAYRSTDYETVLPHTCQSVNCKNLVNLTNAVKVVLDPSICVSETGEPPPLFLCQRCFDAIKQPCDLWIHCLQPTVVNSPVCDHANCRVGFMKAVYFCFSYECAEKNNGAPMRLCEDCNVRLHSNLPLPHITYKCLPELWSMENPQRTYLLDSIVRLWNEGQPDYLEKYAEMDLEVDDLFSEGQTANDFDYYSKIVISFDGIYLLTKVCPVRPTSTYHIENLGQLLAMCFCWVEAVSYARKNQMKKIIHQHRQQALTWLNQVLHFNYELYCSCLLPDPPQYTKVGHPWDILTSIVRKDLEILQRLVTLTRYELLPEKVWDHIMPIWLQEIKEQVPQGEIRKFKTVLNHLFDINSRTCPVFAVNFIKKRLQSSIQRHCHEALVWIQILSYLDVQLEIKSLFTILTELLLSTNDLVGSGSTASAFPFPDKLVLQRVSSGKSSKPTTPSTPVNSLPLFLNLSDQMSATVLMLDVLIKQLTLQKGSSSDIEFSHQESGSLNLLLMCILDQSFESEHTDHQDATECNHCKVINVIFYQIWLLVNLTVVGEINATTHNKEYCADVIRRKSSSKRSNRGKFLVRSYSIAEEEPDEEEMEVKESGSGKSILEKSCLCAIPELRIMESLLQQLKYVSESSVVMHILNSLDVLCLRGKCLQMIAAEDNQLLAGFQKNIFVPSLWKLLQSATSSISHLLVPLLLNCSCLPYGMERICEKIEIDFNCADWQVRFSAVDKVGLICQFASKEFFETHESSKAVLVHAFTYLLFAVKDVCHTVSTKAQSMTQAIRLSALKLIYKLMEEHYTNVPKDRLILLQVYQTINQVMPSSSPLSASLFLQLFRQTKMTDAKLKKKLIFQNTLPTSSEPPSLLPMYSRKLEKFVGKSTGKVSLQKVYNNVGMVPLLVYRNRWTLQAGKSWVEQGGRKEKRFDNNVQNSTLPAEMGSIVDSVLETVLEDDEQRPLHHQEIVLEEEAPIQDEVLSVIVSMLVEFLSAEQSRKLDSGFGTTNYEIISDIIRYIGGLFGFEEMVAYWKVPQNFNTRNLRNSTIFTSYLLNLPKLLDREKEMGSFFLPLSLVLMTTCVKCAPLEDPVAVRTTLVHLSPHLQHAWLTSFIIILYKHAFADHFSEVMQLVSIVWNTLDSQDPHFCRDIVAKPITLSMAANLKVKTRKKLQLRARQFEPNEETRGVDEGDGVENDFSCGILSQSISDLLTDAVSSTEEKLLAVLVQQCAICKLEKFNYDEETVTLVMVALLTFVHMDTAMAASVILGVIQSVIRKVKVQVPTCHAHGVSSTVSVAHQFLRCVFTKLAPNRLFIEMFSVKSKDNELFTKMAFVLNDYTQFNQLEPLKLALEDFTCNDSNRTLTILKNLAYYTSLVISSNHWSPLHSQLKDFYKKLPTMLPNKENMDCVLEMMALLFTSQKQLAVALIEHLDDTMTHIVKNCQFSVYALRSLCAACTECFCVESKSVVRIVNEQDKVTREHSKLTRDNSKMSRDQLKLTRKICLLVTYALTGKLQIGEASFARLVQFICEEIGTKFQFLRYKHGEIVTANAAKALDCFDFYHFNDLLDYMKNPMPKLKVLDSDNVTVDSFESYLKLSVAQIIFAYSYLHSESRVAVKVRAQISELMERLNLQSASLDAQEYFTHVQLLAWYYLASLNHMSATKVQLCHLMPVNKSVRIVHFIEVVLKSICDPNVVTTERQKTQLHVCFLLAQIWTVSMEFNANASIDGEPLSFVIEFWAHLTPMLYPLLHHSAQLQVKTMHVFSSMVENLSVLCPLTFSRFFPLWSPLMQLYVNEIPPQVLLRINSQKRANIDKLNKRDESILPWIIDMHRQLWATEQNQEAQVGSDAVP